MTRDDIRDLGRLRRSSDSKVAGVAGGIARHLDIDPLLVRVAFVLLVVFGGSGIPLYGACWLLIPDEDTDDAMINLDEGIRSVVLTVAGVLSVLAVVGGSFGDWHFPWQLAVVGLVIAFVLSTKDRRREHRRIRREHRHPWDQPGGMPPEGAPASPPAPPSSPSFLPGASATTGPQPAGPTSYERYRPPKPVDPRKRGPLLFLFTMALAVLLLGVVGTVDAAGAHMPVAAYPATVLATCGVMLLVGSFYGRAGGLILVGLVAGLATVATSVADAHGVGQVQSTPTTAAAVKSTYDVGMGEIILDLTDVDDLDALAGRTIHLEATAGHVEVILPDDGLDVRAAADIGAEGHATVFSEDKDGGGTTTARLDGAPGDDPLRIDVDVRWGEVEIHTEESR
ncbi:MAG TPA: PspC domain-containing protein [Nocardioides sp.]|nr:PspC domain-containing protein [Nocardioides sp.]